ncbi:hypothetical protein INS49_004293 [Diaporthe citri]|uniref:uncharacterized protein n=1 Tax=Diaporthe citri TaxID=83186 RepID=UPI001C7F4561|nr:uncharacterized protein INS49_004293 [Diaporthe citri]KAG6355212.1 hypothetical protein INS49_004293 [Diaporthe citri]
MNSTYRHLSSYPPDQNSRSQGHQGSDVSSLQTLDYGAPGPDNMLRRASAVSSRTRSMHASNISLRSPSVSAASGTSTDGTALEPADSQQAVATQQQPTKPDIKESKYNDDKKSTQSPLQRWQWKFETSLLLLGVCSLVAIIVLLAVEDGTTLVSWKFYFSLNTVVSVLGTISRASLASSVGSCIAQEKWNWFRKRQDPLYLFDRFDSASRGPLGSFKLLYWLKFRNWASLGALSVIVLLGYDPFIQAIVTQYGQFDRISDPQGASIATSLNLDVGLMTQGPAVGALESSDGSCIYLGDAGSRSQPDLGMVSSVYAGFSNSSFLTPQTPGYTCRTGNCTWAPFASLAVCASCHDVSRHLRVSSKWTKEDFPSGHMEGNQTTFPLPIVNISNLGREGSISAVGKTRSARLGPLDGTKVMAARGTTNRSETISFTDSDTFVIGFSIINADPEFLEDNVSWESSRPIATECGLQFCTRFYKPLVNQGQLSEGLAGSSIHRNMESLAPDGFNESCVQQWYQMTDYGLSYEVDGDLNLPRSDLQLFVTDAEARQYGLSDESARTFNISDRTLKSSLSWMKQTFTQEQMTWYAAAENTNLWAFVGQSFWNQSTIAVSLTNHSSLVETFDRVADSMTTWMRNLGYAESPVAGTTLLWVLHVRVRWAFMAFPAGTTLAGCVYCLVIMFETRRLGLKPWRDSCLATMAHGIGDGLREKLRYADDGRRGSMKTEGRRLKTMLSDYGDGMMLRDEKEHNVDEDGSALRESAPRMSDEPQGRASVDHGSRRSSSTVRH